MNMLNNWQILPASENESGRPRWTAGPIISSHEGKGFNHTGLAMKVIDVKTYIFEVFPPDELAKRIQQPSADIVTHLEHEGIDSRHLNRRHVSFLAQVSLPCDPEDSSVKITLMSEQRQNGGIYKQETSIPEYMICVRRSPADTALDSLNYALNAYNWYPPY